MKKIAKWVLGLLGVSSLLHASLFAESAQKKEPVFVVLTDDKQPIYDRFVDAFAVQTRADFYEFSLHGDESNAETMIPKLKSMRPQLVVAVGPKSARRAMGQFGEIPLLVAMVPSAQKLAKTQSNVAGVLLEQSPVSRLQMFQKLFPKASRFGFAYDPKFSQARMNEAKEAAESMRLSLMPIPISNPNEVEAALRKTKGQIDALVLLNDPALLNLSTIDAVVQFSVMNKMPTIAMSDKVVERGALLGLSVDYSHLGTQAGQMANRVIFDGVQASALGFVPPTAIQISLNWATAHNFKSSCDIKSRILIIAADNDYDVEVFR